jgi:type II secretory pathway pseudopilin PulG
MVTRLRSAAGFSLVELLLALLISTAIGALVFTTFAIQNRFYAGTSASGRAQQAVRGAADLIASDLRPVAAGAVQVAERDRWVARVAVGMGIVCELPGGGDLRAYFALDGRSVDGSSVAGLAVHSPSGAWSFYPVAWSSLFVSSGGSAVTACTGQGNEDSGFASDYLELNDVAIWANPVPEPGWPLMLYAELEYRFAASQLEPGTRGLFRGPSGGTLVEYASGFEADAHFQYRVDGSYEESVTGASLADVTAVRLVAEAAPVSRAGGVATPRPYAVTIDVPLRNAR